MVEARNILYTTLFLLVITIIGIFYLASSFSVQPLSAIFSDGVTYENTVCISTTGDFEGRETPASEGIVELVECQHNLLYNQGRNMTRDLFTTGDGNGAVDYIALCNSTNNSGCGLPVAAGTEAWVPMEGAGLVAAQGTATIVQDYPGNWSIYHTFTSTAVATHKINMTRLWNSTGSNFSGATFTEVSLETSDQILVNWSVSIV